MTDGKHTGNPTPGPWNVQGKDNGPGERHLHIGDETKMWTVIASMNPSHPHAVANARLIANAPTTAAERDALKAENAELVEALTQIVDAYGVGSSPEQFCESIMGVMSIARRMVGNAKKQARDKAREHGEQDQ